MNIEKYKKLRDSNLTFLDASAKIQSVFHEYKDKKIRVAYSGGSDSDTSLWILRYEGFNPIAVMYDTGLEYAATWNHVDYMRGQGFNIEVIKAKRPIPTSQNKYGHAFISKQVAEMLERLQHHNFDFQKDGNLSFDELMYKYPNTRSAMRWWTNTHKARANNISWNKNLKEFLIEYGLPFKVSGKCCDGAKKLPIKEYTKENDINLMILGIRKSEGGRRASTYKNCFVPKRSYTYSMFFPLFWFKNEEKRLFDETLEIKHSDAYEVYGLKRTGCAGCPFGRNFEEELQVIKKFEPRLDKGIGNIFGKAYEWTRKYKEFSKEKI